VDVLIESTTDFEKDLDLLGEDYKAVIVEKINDCANLFPIQKSNVYGKLHHLPLPASLNGYESSLYMLKISEELGVILTVDEDPIFGQVIFTLFRAVQHDDLAQAYSAVAESLYQDLFHHSFETARIS
jgi:hypothetical protein